MDLGLDGRVAIVTGASRGIGRATAELFGREWARVAVTYRHDREAAEAVAAGIIKAGGDAHAIFFDLASADSIRRAADQVVAKWGRIDILVNNANESAVSGDGRAKPFELVPPAEWQSLLRTNIEGAYAAIQAVLPAMRKQKWGRIVNVSSVAAVDGLHGHGWYSAAKSALHGLTKTLAKEVGPVGVLVNVVMPGVTATERVMTQLPPAMIDAQARAIPIRRVLQPVEVAATIVFLSSAANATITGEIVRASGGGP